MNFIDEVDKAAKFYADTHTEWFDSEGQSHVASAFIAGVKWMRDYIASKPRVSKFMEAEHPLTPDECII